MAKRKISQLTVLTSLANGDLIPIVDVSDTTESASGTVKAVSFETISNSVSGGGSGAVSSVFGRTGNVVAVSGDYDWAEIDKTVSSIADITTKSHTSLTDIGTNTHAQIDTHISNTSNPHSVTKTQVGLGNVTNVEQLPISYLDVDGTLAGNSDVKVASQKATKTYADTKIASSIVDAKGDLISASADNTPVKLAVGANYTKLKADSAESNGLKWQREEVFNVRDYGALGDDSNDDTAEIQAAVDAAEANGGGTVFLPKGIYKTTSEILNNSNGVRIVGESRSGTVIKGYTNTQSVVRFHECDYFALEDLTIFNGITKTGGYGVFFDGTPTQYSVRNVTIENQYYGLGGSPAAGLVDNIYLEDCIDSYIYLTGNGADATFSNIVIDNTTGTGTDVGIKILGAVQGAVFNNIDIHGTYKGVTLDNNAAVANLEWIFFNTVMADSCRHNGWELGIGTGGPMRGINLVGCWSGNNTENGILISSNVVDTNIIGGRIIHNDKHGISITGGLNVLISGNKILNNSAGSSTTYHGINVAAGVTYFNITNNNIASGIANLPAGTQGYGINIASGASDYYVISGNNLYPNGTGQLNDLGSGTNKYIDLKATGTEINTGTDDFKFVTAKAITDSNVAFTTDIPVKASGAEINTGTDDAKFATSKAIKDANILTQAWSSWTPTLTNITIGNGTITGRQTRVGKNVIANLNILFGSTTSVAGSVSISLPVTSVSMTGQAGTIPISTDCVLWDASGTAYSGVVTWSNTTTAGIKCHKSDATYTTIATLSSTVPFTWATGDEISLQIIYEAA